MSGQITKVVDVDVRRRFSEAEKLAIVEESKTAPVAQVARKHGVATSLLFRWRKMQGVRVRTRGPQAEAEVGFVRVALPAPLEADPRQTGIEIVLRSGHRVIVGRDVDGSALKRVIAALEQ